MAVPYSAQVEGYDFAFYFGPNKYAILKKVTDNNGADLHMERLIPLGWGIFGWVNRWCVIPVFDFLRNYIGSFGIIILILVILVKARHLAAHLQELRVDGQDAPDKTAGGRALTRSIPRRRMP